jgi:hypothetical protein
MSYLGSFWASFPGLVDYFLLLTQHFKFSNEVLFIGLQPKRSLLLEYPLPFLRNNDRISLSFLSPFERSPVDHFWTPFHFKRPT